jgi:hypothetical protein
MRFGNQTKSRGLTRLRSLRRHAAWMVVCSVVLCTNLIVSPGHASVVLTYDTPTVDLAPGGSAEIGATLSIITEHHQ